MEKNRRSLYKPIVLHTCLHLTANQTVMKYTPRAISIFVQVSAFESRYFLVLRHILLELHILADLIESFRTLYGLCSCIEIKLLIPLEAHALRLSTERGSSAVKF